MQSPGMSGAGTGMRLPAGFKVPEAPAPRTVVQRPCMHHTAPTAAVAPVAAVVGRGSCTRSSPTHGQECAALCSPVANSR